MIFAIKLRKISVCHLLILPKSENNFLNFFHQKIGLDISYESFSKGKISVKIISEISLIYR